MRPQKTMPFFDLRSPLLACWAGLLISGGAFSQTSIRTAPLDEPPEAMALSPTGTRLYAVGRFRNGVRVMDTATFSVTEVPSTGAGPVPPSRDFPDDIVVSPDGARVYVANGALNRVTVIDAATNTVSRTLTTGTDPSALALTPDGRKLYVAVLGVTAPSTVTVIDTRTLTITGTIQAPVTALSKSMAMHPNGSRLYVAGGLISILTVIDTSNDRQVATLNVGGSRIAISPDGSRLFAFDQFNRRVAVIDTSTNRLVNSIAVPESELIDDLVITPDGRNVCAAHRPGQVSIIDTVTAVVRNVITYPRRVKGLAVSPDSKTAFVVTDDPSDFLMVDLASATIRATSPAYAADYPLPVVSPDGTRVYLAGGLGINVIDTRPAAVTVSAATLLANSTVSPESLATAFGRGLARRSIAAAPPYPEVLGETRVLVRDSRGIERPAGLIAVSPDQINYLIPAGSATGPAVVNVLDGASTVAVGNAVVDVVAPGVFTANANGRGVPAAVALRVGADGAQTVLPVYQCGSQAGSCTPVPISLGGESDTVYLVLFGTGIRAAGTAGIYAEIAGAGSPAIYAGPQGQYPGLDQVNLLIPRSVAGRGEVTLYLSANGKLANALQLRIE